MIRPPTCVLERTKVCARVPQITLPSVRVGRAGREDAKSAFSNAGKRARDISRPLEKVPWIFEKSLYANAPPGATSGSLTSSRMNVSTDSGLRCANAEELRTAREPSRARTTFFPFFFPFSRSFGKSFPLFWKEKKVDTFF